MTMIELMNRRVRSLSLLDIKLAQGCAIFLTLILVKLIPEIISINMWWFIGLLFLCAIKPVYAFFSRMES